jgi:hypothetical protein
MKKDLQGKRDWFILLVHRRKRREKHKDKQKKICRKRCYKNPLLESKIC